MIQDVAPVPKRPIPKDEETPPAKADDTVLEDQPETDESPEFKTPDEVASEDSSSDEPETVESSTPAKQGRRWYPRTYKQWTICSLVVLILAGIAGASWHFLTVHDPKQPDKPVAKVVVHTPTVMYSNLSGLPISNASLNKKPVTAVMVENSTFARPQSGLSQAGVVFEALAEGGITRFMALYQDTSPTNVGPIRSARPYYIQWALGFDAAYAHVGGSPDALSDITSWGVQDMNQFYNGNYFHRITTREAPHNVYTGIGTLNQLEASKNYSSTFTGFPRDNKETPLPQPTASTINFTIASSAEYNPTFTYDATTNSYNRSTDGTPDTDANNNQQLSPKVVIGIVVPLSQGALDASGAYYSNYNVIGSGTAYVFQNGGVTEGQWHKSSNTTQITFTDTSGKTILLNRGQTWITAASSANQISYTGTTQGKTTNQ